MTDESHDFSIALIYADDLAQDIKRLHTRWERWRLIAQARGQQEVADVIAGAASEVQLVVAGWREALDDEASFKPVPPA